MMTSVPLVWVAIIFNNRFKQSKLKGKGNEWLGICLAFHIFKLKNKSKFLLQKFFFSKKIPGLKCKIEIDGKKIFIKIIRSLILIIIIIIFFATGLQSLF